MTYRHHRRYCQLQRPAGRGPIAAPVAMTEEGMVTVGEGSLEMRSRQRARNGRKSNSLKFTQTVLPEGLR